MLNETSCCGVMEIDFIQHHQKPEELITELCFPPTYSQYDYKTNTYGPKPKRIYEAPPVNLLTFTQATDQTRRYGDILRAYILKHKLGQVVTSPSKINPNTHNQVKVYVWAINKRNLAKHCAKLEVK